jgi:CRISPR-associated protein Cmr1
VREFRLTLEIVTPLFSGGADPRGEPELRVPSFRGALRFWFRALLGGVLGNDTQVILTKESGVFGSTESASPVAIRLRANKLVTQSFSELAQKPGVAYLFFSARHTKKEPERKAFVPRQSFELSILYQSEIKPVYASLWLFSHLGGLGSRSRRGGGNLQVLRSEPAKTISEGLPTLAVGAKTPEELQKELAQGIKLLREWAAKSFNGSVDPRFDGLPSFVVLHPDYCRIWVVNKTFNTWDEALDTWGREMQSFRKRCECDYKKVKDVVEGKGEEMQPIERAAFGLPIVFYYPSLDLSATLQGSEHDRRASPLAIRLIKLAGAKEKYALVIMHFINPLLPSDENLKLRYEKNKKEQEKIMLQPTANIVNNFIEQLRKIEALLEVNYKG